MIDTITLVHHAPGRLRFHVRSPAAKEHTRVREALGQTLAEIGGVSSVELNPRSGSLVLKYDLAATTVGKIGEALEARGIAITGMPEDDPAPTAAIGLEDVLSTIASWFVGALAERAVLSLIGALA